jgi:hypothetical protein
MKRFEDLHIEDQMRLALEARRMMTAGNCGTIERFARENELTVREFWRDVCANEGFDECEPWNGFPEGPTMDSWNHASGGNRLLRPYYQKLFEAMRVLAGKDKH